MHVSNQKSHVATEQERIARRELIAEATERRLQQMERRGISDKKAGELKVGKTQ